MKRRILVFLLALCLAAALVPVTAFAGGGGMILVAGAVQRTTRG